MSVLEEVDTVSPPQPAPKYVGAQRPLPPKWVTLVGNSLLWVLWCWLYDPLFRYLATIFADPAFRTNQLLLVTVSALILLQLRRGEFALRWQQPPQWRWLPLGMATGAALGYLLVERLWAINTLATTFFFLATYGFLGLWMAPERWRQGLPAALLLVGVLPFGDHLQSFVGYPMRIATAKLVGEGLRALGIGSLNLETILTFENGIAHVDLPCSGVKSLWTGGLFLLAVTWLERHPLNGRWLITALLFGVLLCVGNFVRVALLIGIGVVGQLAFVAELIHVPLGVLSFGVACGTALWLIKRGAKVTPLPTASANEKGADRIDQRKTLDQPFPTGAEEAVAQQVVDQPWWLTGLLAVVIGGMILLYQAKPEEGLALPPPAWAFPTTIQTTVEPLTADERWWLTKDGAESADRRRFQWGELSGSLLLITSRTWRAHHRPERCFEVKGFTVDGLSTALIDPNFPVQRVALGQGAAPNSHHAVYWFQSADQITADYGTRLWADLTPHPQRWVLVALLFDDAEAANHVDVAPFYRAIAGAVAAGLAGDQNIEKR